MQHIDASDQSVIQTFSAEDLHLFGTRYALDYRFPDNYNPENVLRGLVQEHTFRSGVNLVYSDVEVLESYESRSYDPMSLNVIVMLKGCVRLKVGSENIVLSDHMALTVRLDKEVQIDAYQRAEQHLKVLTLSMGAETLEALGIPVKSGNGWHVWRLPRHLYQGLMHFETCRYVQQLHLEGLSLQLLAQSLAALKAPISAQKARTSPHDWKGLERVREAMQAKPEAQYCLSELAELAAMSPSSLRSKFKDFYEQTLFDFIKERRLEMGKAFLLQGYSVQYAAHFSGYRYATNFATAFRRHFGVAPSSLIQ